MRALLKHPLPWFIFSLGSAWALIDDAVWRPGGTGGGLAGHGDWRTKRTPKRSRVRPSNSTWSPSPAARSRWAVPPTSQAASADEGPQHPVKIGPFWMGKTEVTWDEYDLYWKQEEEAKREKLSPEDKAADAVTRPTPPYADETFGHGRGKPRGAVHHAPRRHGVLPLAVSQDRQDLSPADRGRVGIRLPRRHQDGLLLRRRPQAAGRLRLVRRQLRGHDSQGRPRRSPIPGGCTTCTATWRSGAWITTRRTIYSTFPLDKPTLEPVSLPTANRFPNVARGGSWADKPALCRSAARRGSDKSWIKRDPQRPQSIWWLTDADFVGFRIMRPVEEQANLKGLQSKVTQGK